MKELLYILINFGYIIVFSILAITLFFISLPEKIKGMESYIKARKILGSAMAIMTLFCIVRLLVPQNSMIYRDFWILVVFTLLFSWLSYVSFLYLIDTPRYLKKHFFIDGIVPIVLIMIAGSVGMIYPKTQKAMSILFGAIYILKCIRMFYICVKEYKTCKKELDNYYGEYSDIEWMHILLLLSLILSISTVAAFYIEEIQLIYYIAIPVTYSYMVLKVINFAPKKIDTIRSRNINMDHKPEPEKKEKAKDLSEKIGPLVEEWVREKKFCKAGLTIKDVASEIGTNQNYLSQYLNNCLNMTFQTWLNTRRIEESKILLTANKNLSIEEIGTMVGIPQNYNFSRWFKQVTGMTPFQYRRNSSSRQ